MEEQKNYGLNVVQKILNILLVCAFLFFLLGEVLLPSENEGAVKGCQILEANWERIKSDGTRVPIVIPGECDAQRGEQIIIETKLPKEQQDTWFCIRSMQQELKIYVGGELREEYSTLDSQLFGKTSTMAYVFWRIDDEDAEEILRIELQSDSSYAGFVSEIFVGDKSEIWKYLIAQYAPATVVSIFMLMVSCMVVCVSFLIRIIYKRKVELSSLGIAILIASTWMLVESRLRQFLFPNSTIAMYMGFFMIMLLPYPFALYINKIQKCRYQKAYRFTCVSVVVNTLLSTTLQVLGIKDFFETMTLSHIIIVGLILLLAATIVLDVRRGCVREYYEVAIGLAGMMLMGILEIAMVYVNSSQYNGIPLCLGLVFLLFMAGMKMVRDMLRAEKEKQMAIAASESQAKFLANVSHEIRTPINTIIGMNEMILRENRGNATAEYANNVQTASRMLLGLINDLLDLSKIEAGKLQITEGKYSLAGMLNGVLLGIKVPISQKKLELKLEIDETMPSVLQGDEIRIKQILNNLLTNAVKYTPEGSVTFSAKGIQDEKGFALLCSVKDTGIGIKPEDMEQLFDSFLRLDVKKNRHIEGTGLGLDITKQLVENMNGRIEVESEYGKGSCFTVLIPQQVVDAGAMGSLEQETSAGKLKQEQPTEKKVLYAPDAKVLVVDDNKMNLKVMGALLSRAKMQLDFAESGYRCLEMCREKKYDLVLMDHMMPELDGIQTLHKLRQEKENLNHSTDVIVLTANAIEGVEVDYIREGFSDYMSKPIEVDKLESLLAKYLAEKVVWKEQKIE